MELKNRNNVKNTKLTSVLNIVNPWNSKYACDTPPGILVSSAKIEHRFFQSKKTSLKCSRKWRYFSHYKPFNNIPECGYYADKTMAACKLYIGILHGTENRIEMDYPYRPNWHNRRSVTNQHLRHFSIGPHPLFHGANPDMMTPVHKKSELNQVFSDTSLLNNINKLENPLQKNLGDTVMTHGAGEEGKMQKAWVPPSRCEHSPNPRSIPTNDMTQKESEQPQNGRRVEIYPTLAGIASYITGFFNNITGAMAFQLHGRPDSPESNPGTPERSRSDSEPKYSASETYPAHEESPPIDCETRLDCSKNNGEAIQNKNDWTAQCDARGRPLRTNAPSGVPQGRQAEEGETMSAREAAGLCQDKLLRLQQLLAGEKPRSPRACPPRARPKRIFVDPKSIVVENVVDDFRPESTELLGNLVVNEFVNPGCVTESGLVRVETIPKVKTLLYTGSNDLKVDESLDIVKTVVGEVPLLDCVQNDSQSDKSNTGPNLSLSDEHIETAAPLTFVNAKEACDVNDKAQSGSCDLLQTTAECCLPPNSQTNIIDENKQSEPEKSRLITTCEDKVSRLKALLSERRKNNVTKIASSSSDSNTEPAEATTKCFAEKSVEKPLESPAENPLETRVDKTVASRNSPERCSDIPIESRVELPIEKSRALKISSTGKHRRCHKNPRQDVHSQHRKLIRNNIKEDMTFANEIECEIVSSSVENSPTISITPPEPKCWIGSAVDRLVDKSECFFDEVRGRFRKNSTTDSEDSFQIVFTDSPIDCSPQMSPSMRRLSDCGSEDSFIVFKEGPELYTSREVFGSDTEESDSETDSESDSGCGTKISCSFGNSLSRTVSDLTDDSLYDDVPAVVQKPYSDSEDEVDCSVCTVEEVLPDQSDEESTGLLLTDAKKLARKGLPPKKVQFSTERPRVHVMRVWAYAARQARVGKWEQHSVDRDRFKRRIADADLAISWVLKPQHRARVKFQRFMPWWNAQRRQAAAEKKEKEAQQKEALENLKISGGESSKESDSNGKEDLEVEAIGVIESDVPDVNVPKSVVVNCQLNLSNDKVDSALADTNLSKREDPIELVDAGLLKTNHVNNNLCNNLLKTVSVGLGDNGVKKIDKKIGNCGGIVKSVLDNHKVDDVVKVTPLNPKKRVNGICLGSKLSQ